MRSQDSNEFIRMITKDFADNVMEPVYNAIIEAINERIQMLYQQLAGSAGAQIKKVKAAGEQILADTLSAVGDPGNMTPEQQAGLMKAQIMQNIAGLEVDEKWAKKHPMAAQGLDILRAQLMQKALSGGLPGAPGARGGAPTGGKRPYKAGIQ